MTTLSSESTFHQAVDNILARIESAIDDAAAHADIDSELSNGILTLTFADHSKIIVNRQTPNREIWVAAKSGGFHFRFDGAAWRDTRSDEQLGALLARAVSAQSGAVIAIGALQ